MKIGIIREGKTPPDKRVPFSPKQAALIQRVFPKTEVIVQRSEVRAFEDESYQEAGLNLVDDLNDADVIFGVKEVKIEDLIPNKTYFFFSHTIKEQPYNRELLQTILERNIQLVDYECLTNASGARILGFGYYAGLVGCYNGLLAWGKRSNSYTLKPANQCKDRAEMESELSKVKLPEDFKIALTGYGRVAGGAVEILERVGVTRLNPDEYLNQKSNGPAYTQLSVKEYFKKPDQSNFEQSEVFNSPERFESNFMTYAKSTDLYVACHYWDSNGPNIFEREDLASPDFRIKTIADISCDIAGPIPSTIRPSTIADPIYEVDKQNLEEVSEVGNQTITVMAVDNLPCELPKDASEGFGSDLIEKVLPCLFGEDSEDVIGRATIAQNGDLSKHFEYLRDYVEKR